MFLLLNIEGSTEISAIEISETATASALYQLIQTETNIPISAQHIIFNGIEVPNTAVPLNAIGITEGTELNGNDKFIAIFLLLHLILINIYLFDYIFNI